MHGPSLGRLLQDTPGRAQYTAALYAIDATWKQAKLPRKLSGYSMQVQPDQEAVTNEKGIMPALYTASAARGKLLSR
eukprot:4223736-Pleurochrysis_carterae.AAC.1